MAKLKHRYDYSPDLPDHRDTDNTKKHREELKTLREVSRRSFMWFAGDDPIYIEDERGVAFQIGTVAGGQRAKKRV